MNLGIIKTISGRIQIVDIDDDNAPMITLHNEFNRLFMAEKILKAIYLMVLPKDIFLGKIENREKETTRSPHEIREQIKKLDVIINAINGNEIMEYVKYGAIRTKKLMFWFLGEEWSSSVEQEEEPQQSDYDCIIEAINNPQYNENLDKEEACF
jgi:hypothetical protein